MCVRACVYLYQWGSGVGEDVVTESGVQWNLQTTTTLGAHLLAFAESLVALWRLLNVSRFGVY